MPRCSTTTTRAFTADHSTTYSTSKDFPLAGGSNVNISINSLDNGLQEIIITTDLGGRPLLHWGVEGGSNYKGGWRLPKDGRPDGTVEYKKRALQTPIKQAGGDNVLQLKISLPSNEASDFLNFVIKDEATGTWYDLQGQNFQIPLRKVNNNRSASQFSNREQQQQQQQGTDTSTTATAGVWLPLDSLPPLPQDLCGIWAYIKWEADGCPNRSKEEADNEYRNAINEMTTLLRQGQTLDDLWKVANGHEKYRHYIGRNAALLIHPVKKVEHEPKEEENGHCYQHDDAEQQDQAPPSPSPSPPPPHQQQQQEQAAYIGDGYGAQRRSAFDLINKGTAPLLREAPRSKKATPLGPLKDDAGADETCVWHRLFNMGQAGEVLVAVHQEDPANPDSKITVNVTTDINNPVLLHWGVKKSSSGGGRKQGAWEKPSSRVLFPGSVLLEEGIAAEAPFTPSGTITAEMTETESEDEEDASKIRQRRRVQKTVPLQALTATFPKGHGLAALTFVIRSEDGTAWYRDAGGDFLVPLPGPRRAAKDGDPAAAFDDDLSRRIVDAEVNSGAWTLMHRFNLASDILNAIVSGHHNPPDQALAKVFVWLRYSAMRQLTWQRNYNTQPRILGAAQERLTHTIADAFNQTYGPAREWARSLLTTVGRGGNAQAVRDEILAIMHRNKISEVKGTWMEEWHQKLHNNTTPDDIPICEAYLAYLQHNGDLDAYWRVLSEAGISRQRLESFDRAIVTDPVFYGDKKDSLIRDFQNYLKILKSTHSGADLQASASAAAPHLPEAARGHLGYVLGHVGDPAVLPLIEAAVEARTELLPALGTNRETLYLDLALENVVRGAAERGAAASGTGAAALIGPLLQNLALSLGDNEEICYCLKAWQELPVDVKSGRPPAKDDALKAMAVIDRISRALATLSESATAVLAPTATAYGDAMSCEPWAVQLFAEEVIRGGPAFAVSLALSSVTRGMRSAAELGAWQVISPSQDSTEGILEIVDCLYEVQEKYYTQPTILYAKRVTGEEEVPEGVVGVVSGDAPDVLSHLSVRARNLRVLFAACYDEVLLGEIEGLAGKTVGFSTTAAGAVSWHEIHSNNDGAASTATTNNNNNNNSNGVLSELFSSKLSAPTWCKKWVLNMDEFGKEGMVGAKSRNLAGLRGRLPDWINVPSGVTVPFGTFEQVLGQNENKEIAKQLKDAVSSIDPTSPSTGLAKARALVMKVTVPPQLEQALLQAMQGSNIPPPADDGRWDQALTALKSVWASKYNDRAYLSCKKVGLDFNAVSMAVLCQRVVPAQYAFVIHTANPTNGNTNEVYCELVRGLGESIVSGLVPGTALAFVAPKTDLDNPQVLLYPSKSEGMFVDESLIFRSDSNGEDLDGYAGAGLYESVTMDVTYSSKVDYSEDPVMKDAEFRRQLMAKVAKVGAEIEKVLGSAQDVEGVVDKDGNVYVVQTRPQM
jgi:alpha-glucan, water dikinase